MDTMPTGLPELIEGEAQDAMRYAHLALEHRTDHPELADMFMQLSGEELKHMQMIAEKLASMVSKLHDQYKGV